MYDPSVGRFLSEDPIGFAGGDANLYRYVGNSPTNFTDPSGLQQASPEFTPPPMVLSQYASDWAGEAILHHWLEGTGRTVTVLEGKWGKYMRKNDLLPPQLAAQLVADAFGSIGIGFSGSSVSCRYRKWLSLRLRNVAWNKSQCRRLHNRWWCKCIDGREG